MSSGQQHPVSTPVTCIKVTVSPSHRQSDMGESSQGAQLKDVVPQPKARMDNGSKQLLVGGIPTPLKNSISQLGLWHSQLNGKTTCSKPPTRL